MHYARNIHQQVQPLDLALGTYANNSIMLPYLMLQKVNDRIDMLKQEIINSSTEEIYTDEIYNLRQQWSISD